MVSKARARAEKSGVPFDAEYFTVAQITAWLRVHRGCECCSRAFEYGKRERIGPHPNSATLDRVRPERGYVQGNVALLCWRCNRIKSDATPDELERIAAWVRRRLR